MSRILSFRHMSVKSIIRNAHKNILTIFTFRENRRCKSRNIVAYVNFYPDLAHLLSQYCRIRNQKSASHGAGRVRF
jgi:hypothetical protein